METKEIRKLLDKYYEGETSLAEEKLLRAYFEDTVTTEFRDDQRFLAAVGEVRVQKNEDFFLPDRFMFKISSEENDAGQQKYKPRSLLISMAATVALLLVGFGGGVLYEKESSPRHEVSALKEEVGEVKRLLMMNQLQQVSASERIMAVREVATDASLDSQVLEALIYTLNADPNANVRLASVEALSHFVEDSAAAAALQASLNQQENPLVQIAILDVLIQRKQKDAVDEIRLFLQQDDLAQEVREQAEIGLSRLM